MLTKMADGKKVQCSAEEEAEILAEWAENDRPRTSEEIDAEKSSIVEQELGSDVVRIIIETIVPMIQDGSIASKTPNDVIAQAKANRMAEL